MESKPTRLYLIRHGATASNEMRPYILQGKHVDHSLSETGQKQAAALGRFMENVKIDCVYASPMKRAQETAAAIAEPKGLAITTIDAIHEVDVGDWESQQWAQIMVDSPDEYRAFMSDPWSNCYVGGESYQDVYKRVWPELDRLLNEHSGQSIAVVAHQVVNRSTLASVMDFPRHRAREIRQANTGINVIRRQDSDDELITLNGCFHLDHI